MHKKLILSVVIGLFFACQVFAAGGGDLQIKATNPGASVTVERQISDTRVVISVTDKSRKPVFGLGIDGFAVASGSRTAKITSVQPISESLDVPRHIVLVLDNSDSMRQRNAIEPLLAGVDELLKIVRPIDQVQVVVFSGRESVQMAGRDLRVRTFKSSNPIDVKNFVAEVYRNDITLTTRLYEAMLAGLEVIRTMPENEPRFMVVFSDGEDLNSAYKEKDVIMAADGIGRFRAYGIDYMPGSAIDPFLKEFADGNDGEVWKATSETNLVPIFQSVASKMQYYYVVNYLFPTTGSLSVAPTSLTIDEIEALPPITAGAAPDKGASVVRRSDPSTLTFRPVLDTVYGIENWKLTVAHTGGALAVQYGEELPPAEITLPVKAEDLGKLAVGGDITATMEVKDKKGQNIALTSEPVKIRYFRTTGRLLVAPETLTIEEIKTIDSSPMLGYIYFTEGSSEISDMYVRLTAAETASFDEQRFRGTMEKYYQGLNIIGKRLASRPEATITIVGCNSDTGVEKNRKKLSLARAETVRDYFQAVWNISPERMKLEARNLPAKPSTRNLKEGQAENRRVEIQSPDLDILAPIRSTYFETRIDAAALMLSPVVNVAHGVARWSIAAANSNGVLGERAGEGAPPAEVRLPLKADNLNEMAVAGDINITMKVEDLKKQELSMTAAPVRINFIKTSQRLAEKKDFRVQEKYALILFEFDSDAISAGNQEIVDRIVTRIKELPDAKTEIVGHTDTIGKENYNIKLSERRARAVHKLLAAAYGADAGDRLIYRGVGPNEPLYDNMTPEARAFNRTVTITLEYMTKE